MAIVNQEKAKILTDSLGDIAKAGVALYEACKEQKALITTLSAGDITYEYTETREYREILFRANEAITEMEKVSFEAGKELRPCHQPPKH